MYKIVLEKRAKKFLDKLSQSDKIRIISAIERLPEGEDIKRLKGHDDILRLRVGNFRILYRVDNNQLVVIVIDIGNRGDVYKRY